ncbi:putative ribonuclease H-like domain-containing protein [Tanacetum coccineum]
MKNQPHHHELTKRLSRVHSMFHVLKLKKCMADEPLSIPLDEIQVDDKLHFVKELVKIMDREVKHLKQSRLQVVTGMLELQERVLSSTLGARRPNAKRNTPASLPEFCTGCSYQRRHDLLETIRKLNQVGSTRQNKIKKIMVPDTPPIPTPVDLFTAQTKQPHAPCCTPSIDDHRDTIIQAPTIKKTPPRTIHHRHPDTQPASERIEVHIRIRIITHIPSLPAISPFLSSADDTTNSDTPDTPPSPTHGPAYRSMADFKLLTDLNGPNNMMRQVRGEKTEFIQGNLTLDNLRNQSRIGINKWYQSFCFEKFVLEVLEFESAHSNTTAKLPILKLGKQLATYGSPKNINFLLVQNTDAKTMVAAIKTRFGGSRILIVGLQNFGLKLKQHKPEIETMSIDDLYNNFKIVEQKVKKSVSGAQNMAFMTAPSTSSTNHVNTVMPAYEVSTDSPNVNTASPQVSTASFSDNAVYAFMVENPNGSNLLQQDLEQIHEDDLEAMDLKWQLSLLSMRAKRYYQRTGKKIFINANDTAGYDKSKVECFNCHKMGHFARECRAPRNKEGQFKYQDNTRKQGNNEDTSSKAMLAIDGVGFDWSDMAEEQVQTNMALMAFSDSEVYNDKTCSKTCLKNYETLKKQCDDLIVKLNQTEFTAATYKRGLATVEEQLITYRKNEVLFSEEVAVLKREVACKDYEINVLKSEFEKVKQEKEGIEFKIEKFDKASKDLDKLLGSQITDKSKKGLGYNDVPPPHPLIYNRPKKLDLSYSGLDEFKDPEFKSYGSEDSKQESNIVCDKKSDASKENSDDSLVKEQVSEDTSSFVESSLNVDKETVFLVDKKIEFNKSKNHEKPVKKSVRSKAVNTARPHSAVVNAVRFNKANAVKIQVSNGLHMTENIAYLLDFKEFDEGYVTFGGGVHGGRISGKETLKTDSLDFEDVYFVNELKFNLFSVSQMCDKKNYVIFTDTECLVLSPNFKLPDETQINLKIPRKDNMYSFDMKNIVPKESLTYLVAKATSDESMLWHMRLSHINFKNINKLVKDNLVRGFPTKHFENNQTCVACLKGKQHLVYNTRTKRVEENLHIGFLENKPMIEGNGLKWLFDINYLTQSMNYVPVVADTITNGSTGTQGELNAGTSTQKEEISQDCIVMPIWKDASYFDSPSKDVGNGEPKSAADDQKQVEDGPDNENDEKDKSKDDSSPKEVNAAGQHVNTASPEVNTGRFKLNTVDPSVSTASSNDQDSPKDMFKLGASHTLETTHVEFFSDEDEPEVDLGNITNSYTVPPTPNTRIHKDHPITNVIGDVKSSIQTRRMTKSTSEQGFLSAVYEQKTHDTLNTCLYACFLSQIEPTSIAKALYDSSWVEEMQEELLQFKLQQVWILVDLPIGKRAIGIKWVFGNKKDKRGIVIRNKARLVAQGHRQEEGIDYEEVFAPVARIEAIRLFLAYASFMGFLITQPPGFKDPDNPDKVYKVVKALYGLHQAPRACQDKYVDEILKKFNYTDAKSASTLVDLEKPLVKDGDANNVDVHLYRSMIRSLMYLISSRPDIMFAVCVCARFQVTPKTSHLLAVKRIFRYLKGKPTLGL